MSLMRITRVLGCLLLSATATFAETMSLEPSTSRPGQPVIASIGNQSLANPAHIDGITDGGNNTIIIDASPGICNAVCRQEEEVWIRAPRRPGTYSVQYWVTAGRRTLAAQAQLVVADLCDFGHSLTTATAGVAGGFVGLAWCDPSYSMDGWNYAARFFRIYSAQSPNGPFSPVFDVTSATGASLKPSSSGTTFCYIESHGCLGFGSGCNQSTNFDMTFTTNIIAVSAPPSAGCVPSDTTLCALHDRFSITAHWTTADGHQGIGLAVPITDGSGYFSFFNRNSVEVTVKVLDACSLQFPAFWVFISGMTNVKVDLTVTDTVTHTTKTYSSPLGTPFVTVLDTNAFSCR